MTRFFQFCFFLLATTLLSNLSTRTAIAATPKHVDSKASKHQFQSEKAREKKGQKTHALDRESSHQKSSRSRSESEDEESARGDASGEGPECRAKLLMDASSGDILFEENAHQPLPPASMVKLMTAYVILERVSAGQLKMTDAVTASTFASKIGGSQVYLKQGEQFSVSQLLEALMIQSANDAAMALAEHVGGSSEGFVVFMNEAAKKLGMTESVFHSPHGLPPGEGQEADVVSAHDFGILARNLIQRHPEILEFSGKLESGFRDNTFQMLNHNHLLRHFQGCDGLKTGYYAQAGFSVTATAQRETQRMIAVVMGCKQRAKRDNEAANLLASGFSQYKTVSLIEKGSSVTEPAKVSGGTLDSVRLVSGAELTASVKSGDENKIERKFEICSGLKAPVNAQTPCGTITFLLGTRELGKVPLVISEDVPATGVMGKLKKSLGL